MGNCEVAFDWSYAMIESSQETYSQLIAGEEIGVAEVADVRMFLYPNEDIEEARERCAEIAAAKAESSDILLKQALAAEASNV